MHFTDGNGSDGEKLDAYWHIGEQTKSSDAFDNRSKQPWVKSWNHNDGEPVSHPNGFHNLN